MKCSNCELHEASFICTQCSRFSNAEEDLQDAIQIIKKCSLYCASCKELHLLMKATKTHNLQGILISTSCSNCDIAASSIVCMDCIATMLPDESINHVAFPLLHAHFCSSCFNLHKQIKLNRSHLTYISIAQGGIVVHAVNAIRSNRNRYDPRHNQEPLVMDAIYSTPWASFLLQSLERLWDRAQNFLEEIHWDMTERTYREAAYWRSLLTMVFLCLFLNMLCKYLLGATGTITAVMALGLFVIILPQFHSPTTPRQRRKGPPPSLHAPPQIDKGSRNEQETSSSGDYPSEFWYPLEWKQAQFKPRVRMYERRKKRLQGSSG